MSDGGAQRKVFGPFFDDSGDIYRGIKVLVTTTGTTNAKTYWTDEAKTTAVNSGVLTDSDNDGIATAFFDGDYRFRVTQSDDSALDNPIDWDTTKVTSDTATMWEGNFGTTFPTASADNRWQLFAKNDGSNNFQQLGINEGSAFKVIIDATNIELGSDFADLDAAVTAIGATETTLIIRSQLSVGGTPTVPETMLLLFERGGSLSFGAGETVTVDGQIQAGKWQIFDSADSGDITFGSSVTVRPDWWATNTTPGTTDMTNAIQYAVDSVSGSDYSGSVILNSDNLVSIINLYSPISFGGEVQSMGGRWNYSGQDWTGARLITSAATGPAIFIAGQAASALPWSAQGVHVHDLIVIPDGATADAPANTYDGQDGITISGASSAASTNNNASRNSSQNIVFDRVTVRQFARNNFRIEGNVFDVRFNESVSTVPGEDGVKFLEFDSTGQDSPGQMTFINCYLNSDTVSGTPYYAVDASNTDGDDVNQTDVRIFSGGVSGTGHGVRLGTGSSIDSTHFEATITAGTIGIHIVGPQCRVFPKQITSYETGMQVGNAATAGTINGWFASVGLITSATNGLVIMDGGSRTGTWVLPVNSSVTNEIVNTRLATDGLMELKVINPTENFMVILTPDDTTPTVLVNSIHYKNFKTANTVNTAYTDFDDAFPGQTITILISDANTDFTHGAPLNLSGATSWNTAVAGDTISFIFQSAVWYEISRSVNT